MFAYFVKDFCYKNIRYIFAFLHGLIMKLQTMKNINKSLGQTIGPIGLPLFDIFAIRVFLYTHKICMQFHWWSFYSFDNIIK